MKSVKDLRKEKQLLLSYVDKCKQYISQLQTRISELSIDYKKGKLTREGYLHYISQGVGGKSFRHYIQIYSSLLAQYHERIRRIDSELTRKGRQFGILAILILVFLSSLLVFTQPEMTGQVVFWLKEPHIDQISGVYMKSTNITWIPEKKGRLNAFAVTGEYQGKGSLKIYLDLEDESKLVYAAEESSQFESECQNACNLYQSLQDSYRVRIEMPEGNRLVISRIDYVVSELKEFSISPSNASYELSDTRLIINNFKIHNSRQKNFSVAIHAEGDLTKHTTLYDSYISFGEDDITKNLDYEIDLPLQISPGIYKEKIIVRYLTPTKFKGPAPVEEYQILVRVLPPELEKPSPWKLNYWQLMLGILAVMVVINVIIFFLKNLWTVYNRTKKK